MKTHDLVSIALLALAGSASAQSTATIYGVIDLSYQHVTAGDAVGPGVSGQSINRLDGSQYTLAGNRLGFRIAEDLGGGLRAGGVLEAGHLPDTGQQASAAAFWNRQVFVSLGSSSMGDIRLGRQYRLQDETVALNSPFNNAMILGPNFGYRTSGTLAAPAGFIPMFVDNARVDNAVQYRSPIFSGFSAQVMVAAGEGVVPRYHGARASYANGPASVAVSFETDGPGVAPKAKMVTVGAAYDFGIAKVMGGYQRGNDLNANFVGAATNPGALSGNIGSYQDTASYTLGVRKDIGLFGLGANYSRTKFENAAGQGVTLGRVAFGGTYSLSRQTRLYAAYGQATGDLKERIVEGRLFQVGINKMF